MKKLVAETIGRAVMAKTLPALQHKHAMGFVGVMVPHEEGVYVNYSRHISDQFMEWGLVDIIRHTLEEAHCSCIACEEARERMTIALKTLQGYEPGAEQTIN